MKERERENERARKTKAYKSQGNSSHVFRANANCMNRVNTRRANERKRFHLRDKIDKIALRDICIIYYCNFTNAFIVGAIRNC